MARFSFKLEILFRLRDRQYHHLGIVVIIAQQFTAGMMQESIFSPGRGRLSCHALEPLFQPSASRTRFQGVFDPSDKSLGYFHSLSLFFGKPEKKPGTRSSKNSPHRISNHSLFSVALSNNLIYSYRSTASALP
jgi:hypothetical protein